MLDRTNSTIAHEKIMGSNTAALLRSSQEGFGVREGWHCDCIRVQGNVRSGRYLIELNQRAR